jgi:hypothetical protein
MTLADPGDNDNERHGKGKKAREAEVNARFDALDQRLLSIEFGLRAYVAIDCNGGGIGGGGGGTSDSGGGLSGDPVIIEGGVSEGGVTSGPNFETGRRTWIDILSQ